MPDITWNKATWDGKYDWTRQGDEWSAPWGTSAAMWFATIMPRIGMALPAESVLEIAPGHGRCTEFLLRFTSCYNGVDLSEQCVTFCRERFASNPNARFHQNDGQSLGAVHDQLFDLVFSFDSLVHADLDAVSAYVPQILALLRPGGIAFIHHSNLGACPGREWGHRSTEVSAEVVASLVERHGGRVLIQEIFGDGIAPSDCFSTFCRQADHSDFARETLGDSTFLTSEARVARDTFVHYLALRPSARAD